MKILIAQNESFCQLSHSYHQTWMWSADQYKEYQKKSNLSQYSHFLSIKSDHSLPHLLASSSMLVHLLKELPLYYSKAETGVKYLKEVRKELLDQISEVTQLVEIARPYACDMNFLIILLTRVFHQNVHFKIFCIPNVIVFAVSAVLHLFFMLLYHKNQFAGLRFPKVVRVDKRKTVVTVTVRVFEDHLVALTAPAKKLGHHFLFPQPIPSHVSMKIAASMCPALIAYCPLRLIRAEAKAVQMVERQFFDNQFVS